MDIPLKKLFPILYHGKRIEASGNQRPIKAEPI